MATVQAQCPILQNDREAEAAMTLGSEWLLNAMRRERGEQVDTRDPRAFGYNALIWSSLVPTRDAVEETAAYLRRMAREREAEARRVARDPCPRCGVRADHGCKHGRFA